ncbi:myogenesis-regulating glycosidase-like [Panonychus citri]|uniref:myogenesis-regulating glycosidase-like n=1 Tax=Panonychus citri TaxID=50023 RepID=UPI002307EEAA|nr:myogenesis-regulating glycosidase-like [Panonychus citri]
MQSAISNEFLVKDGRSQKKSASVPSSPELSSSRRRGSQGTVLQLSEDNGTWKIAGESGIIKEPVKMSRVSMILELSKRPEFRHRISVALFFLCIIVLVMSTTLLDQRRRLLKALSIKIFLHEDQRVFTLLDSTGSPFIKVNYGVNLPFDIKPYSCYIQHLNDQQPTICRDWEYRAHLTIDHQPKESDINCYRVSWESYSHTAAPLKDCINLGDGSWFGMGETFSTPWPLNGWTHNATAFVTNHSKGKFSPLGQVIKRYWFSSKGISVSVPLHIPLFFSFNSTSTNGLPDRQLCLEARTNTYPYDYTKGFRPNLEYTICTGSNVNDLHTHVSRTWLAKTRNQTALVAGDQQQVSIIPQSIFLEKPIWNIDKKVMTILNHEKMENYSTKIVDFGIEPGFLLIDMKWEKFIGDLRIDSTQFPEPSKEFTILKRRGFKILLSVSPFIELSSPLFTEAFTENRVFTHQHLKTPLITRCDPESTRLCAVINLINSTTRGWFENRLTNLTDYSIHGLLFKGIQVSRMPHFYIPDSSRSINPDMYQIYYKSVARSSYNLFGMDSSAGTKGIPGFIRIAPLESSWRSLRTIIPTVLSIGLVGFPIINPGSVGGDIPILNTNETTDELYIRWFELATFLPVLQLSNAPRGDITILKLVKKFINIREHQLLPVMKNCMEDHLTKGWPIVRPIWWLDSQSPETYTINDQFSIGNDILVAPILDMGKTTRDIYLPSGWWKDEILGQTIRGGKWMRNYSVELYKIAYFTRMEQA